VKEAKDSRMTVLANLWMQHGCPEKMTIHVKKTGETITLIDGMPLESEVKTTDMPCVECGRPLPVGNPKFCSVRCGRRHHHRLENQRKLERADERLRTLEKAS
jgi:hypothetical protein